MLTVLAGTGEISQINAPGNLRNVSYTVDLIVPLVRCRVSDEKVRSLTVASAYDQAMAGLEGLVDISNSTIHVQNLTFTPYDNVTQHRFEGQIGYYALHGDSQIEFLQQNTTGSTYEPDELGELWLAIANPPNGTHGYDYPNPYGATYYTCTMKNASVTTNVTFVDNIQSLQAINVKEVDMAKLSPDQSASCEEKSPDWALWNYQMYGTLLYDLLSGIVLNIGYPEDGNYGWNWTTTVDQTILGTAEDFSIMTAAWKDGGLEDSAATQRKNLAMLIEEFSLNASLSLMALPKYK